MRKYFSFVFISLCLSVSTMLFADWGMGSPFIYLKGFINKNGEVVIKPQYRDVQQYSDGLAAVKFTLVDGKIVDEFTTNKALDEGKLNVEITYKWGFIDTTGKVVIQPQYDDVLPFSEGLAAVMNLKEPKQPMWGYINTKGKMVIPQMYERVESFNDGIACVRIMISGNEGYYGYIDKKNKYIIQPKYPVAYPFYEGLAYVAVKGIGKQLDGYFMNIKEEVVIPLKDMGYSGTEFREGWLCVLKKVGPGLYIRSFLDKTGQPVFTHNDIKYYEGKSIGISSALSEGIMVVGSEGKSGYALKTGEVIIPPQYSEAFMFRDGLGLVVNITDLRKISREYEIPLSELYSMDTFIYLDKTGEKILEISKYTITNCKNNTKNKLYGHIEKAEPFSEGYAVILIRRGK